MKEVFGEEVRSRRDVVFGVLCKVIRVTERCGGGLHMYLILVALYTCNLNRKPWKLEAQSQNVAAGKHDLTSRF